MRKNKKTAVVVSAAVILLALFGYEIKKIDEKKLNNQEEIKVAEKNQDNDLPNWKIPEDEIFIDFLNGDTNQDNSEETLVIAENAENPLKKKVYFYVFDKSGKKIFYKEGGISPDSVELRKFGDDNYQSFFLIFEGQFNEGFFIRWNGAAYAIPEEEKGNNIK